MRISTVKFQQLVREKYIYTNKDGSAKVGKRMVSKSCIDGLHAFRNRFNRKGLAYLLHHFECMNDNFIRHKFLMIQSWALSSIWIFQKTLVVHCNSSSKQTLHINMIYSLKCSKPIYDLSDNNNHDH